MNNKEKIKKITSLIKNKMSNGLVLSREEVDRVKEEISFVEKNPSLLEDIKDLLSLKKTGNKNKPNSMLFYALGVTSKKADLDKSFRFNFEVDEKQRRMSPPDVDTDFEDREGVLNYLCEKYGEDRVALIGTTIGFKPKAAIQMCAKALDVTKTKREGDRRFSSINDQEAKRLSKIIPNNFKDPETGKELSIKQIIGEEEIKGKSIVVENIQSLMKEEYKRYPKVFEHAIEIEGMSKAFGTHAAGVVISRDPLVKDVPLHYTKMIKEDDSFAGILYEDDTLKKVNLLSTQYDMNEVEELGLLKFDFLQLENLRQMTLVEKLIEEHDYKGKSRIEFDLENLETNDPKVFKTIDNLKLEGLFQISGKAFKSGEVHSKNWETGEFYYNDDGTPKMKHKKGLIEVIGCSSFDDIAVANALGRPGPLISGMHYKYSNNKKNPDRVEYPHEKLEPILEKTYGILCYQEQLTRMAQELAGFTYSEADKLRKVCGKKKPELLEPIKPLFYEGCKKNKIPQNIIDQMWDLCVSFGAYAFNANHSYAYGLICYQTAFLKTYFTTEFICAVLSSAVKDEKKLEFLTASFKSEYEDLKIYAPHINNSRNHYVPVEKMGITAPFSSIKGLGEKVSEEIVSKQPYVSISDFVLKNNKVNKGAVELLVSQDVFREFGDIKTVTEEYKRAESIKKRATKMQGKKSNVKTKDLF